MKRLVPLAVVLSLLPALSGPVMAGSWGFDLPVLTWPEGGAEADGAVTLGSKGGR